MTKGVWVTTQTEAIPTLSVTTNIRPRRRQVELQFDLNPLTRGQRKAAMREVIRAHGLANIVRMQKRSMICILKVTRFRGLDQKIERVKAQVIELIQRAVRAFRESLETAPDERHPGRKKQLPYRARPALRLTT